MHSHNYSLRQLYGRRFIEGEADAFIYHDQISRWNLTARLASSILRDLPAHMRCGDLLGLGRSPIRRTIFHWAYLRGHRFGWNRRRQGNLDATQGQRVVLERYG